MLLGINDIGQASPTTHPEEQVSAEEIIVGLKQFALRAHAHGIRIIGGTLTPYEGAAYFSAQGEEKREVVNAWIRTAKEFDGVIDFDAALRDPAVPTQHQVFRRRVVLVGDNSGAQLKLLRSTESAGGRDQVPRQTAREEIARRAG